MACYVYILYSESMDVFYVGSSNNVLRRLQQHNNGESSYTSRGIPWILLWSVQKPNRASAKTLERKIKNLTRKRKMKFMRKHENNIYNALIFNNIGIIN